MSELRPHRSFTYHPKSLIKNLKYNEDFEKIRAHLLGSKTLFTDDIGIYDLGDGREWRRPKQISRRPLFVRGHPNRFDSIQGHLGDCWLVSSIIALTTSSRVINHVVPADQDFDHRYVGAFHFRIWILGQWYDVVVDDRLPFDIKANKPLYVHSRSGNVFWACLLEKAYYKVWMIKNSQTTYNDVLEGGFQKTACQDFTGGIIEMFNTERIKLGEQFERWMMDIAWSEALLCCSGVPEPIADPVGLSAFHAYAITKVFKVSHTRFKGLFLMRVMDPTATREWRGKWGDEDDSHWMELDWSIRAELGLTIEQDGEFWMDEENFKKYFGYLTVCHVGPGRYISSKFNSGRNWDPKYWQTASFKGEWVPNLTAAGSDRSHRHENPQYVIKLEWAENDERQSQDPQVVIDLVQRSKKGRDYIEVIGFFVYSLSEHVKLPLDQNFVMVTIPLLATEFKIRSLAAALKLKPGRYGIIPCTEESNVESQFLLRVYSECQIVTEVVSDTLSKSVPQEEEPSVDYDERLRRIFYCEAGKEGEVDHIGLKHVLGAMDSNSVFGVSSIIKFFLGILSFSRSGGYDTNDLAFTKDECRNMVAILDMNHSGKIGFSEFCDLWAKITFWTKVYGQYEDETLGLMKAAQLRNALGAMGYNIDMRTVHSLTYVYADDDRNITLRDFILCAISLQTVLNECQRDGKEMAAEYEFTIEEWVRKTLSL